MKISTYLEEMCTNPYISLFFHDGRVDVLDSDGEYVDYICYQEDFETDDELIREVAEFASYANKCKTDAETVAFLKYQFGVIPVQNADIPVLSSEYGREFMCRIGTAAVIVKEEHIFRQKMRMKPMPQRRIWNSKTSHGTIIIRLKTCRRNEDKYIS